MESFITTVALAVAGLNTLAAAIGGFLWWQVSPQPWAWVPIRVGQVAAMVLAGSAGVAYVTGARADDALFWLYALLPVAIGIFAEQFRLLAAQTVLDARGLPDAHAVGRLPAAEQESVVRQILRRELGVMALAAGVIAFLALRAAQVTAGL